jgi:hypothetical protein
LSHVTRIPKYERNAGYDFATNYACICLRSDDRIQQTLPDFALIPVGGGILKYYYYEIRLTGIIYYYYIHGTQKLQKVMQDLTPAQTTRENFRASADGIPRTLPDSALSPVEFLVNGKLLSDVPCAEDRYLHSAKSCFPVRFDLRAVHKDKATTETTIQVFFLSPSPLFLLFIWRSYC